MIENPQNRHTEIETFKLDLHTAMRYGLLSQQILLEGLLRRLESSHPGRPPSFPLFDALQEHLDLDTLWKNHSLVSTTP